MKFFLPLFLFVSRLFSYSIVFVHIGDEIPSHVPIAIDQARIFNPNCPIYLIGSEDAFKRAPFQFGENVHLVLLESLQQSKAHRQFVDESKLSKSFMQGFWSYTSERFFYLEELIRERGLTDVFHLENDVMLYADLESMLPIFQAKYPGIIGATFENDARAIAGFMYISDLDPISELVKFMGEKAKLSLNDMEALGAFKNEYDKVYIEHLPIIFPEYHRKIGLKTSRKLERYSQYFNSFHAIFDGLAIGQYIGGLSPRNGKIAAGYIDRDCIFNVSRLKISWKLDEQKRWIPYASFENVECPIINLHIHCKDLSRFHSRRPG